MKWLNKNKVELVLGISSSVFLINIFALEDDDLYILSIPFFVLGLILLYKRHFVIQNHSSFMTDLADVDEDLYEEAKQAVLESGKASTSFLQRKFQIGYSRSARLIDMLEEGGVIGPADGIRPREVKKP
jgi:DNA segregation ATPase FtsK/SpoIIIE-like protein